MAIIQIIFKEKPQLERIQHKVPLTLEEKTINTFDILASCLKEFLPIKPDELEGTEVNIVTKIYEAPNIVGQSGYQAGSYQEDSEIHEKVDLNTFKSCSNRFLVATKYYNYNNGDYTKTKWYKVEWIINNKYILESYEQHHYDSRPSGGGGGSDDFYDSPGD